MTRSKFSTKVVLLATAIGLSTVAFAGSQPAAPNPTLARLVWHTIRVTGAR
jgi:hypothetical protein